MTNKKKTGTKKSKKAAVLDSPNPTPMPEVKPYAFSHAQFATLLMISMGIQRVLQVRSAYGGNEAAPICVEFLGESACTDESVMSLLHMKFHTALQCIILAAAVALQCWKTEPILRQLNALFILSPITTGLSTMFFAESISQGALLTQTMLGLVLAVVAAPSATNLPFCTGKYTSFMTLPSMALGSLALGNLVLAYQYVRLTTMTVRSGGDSDKITFPLLAIDPVFYQELPANMVTAVTTIVLFLAVDALTTALLYAHSWFALPDTHQRCSNSSLLFIFGVPPPLLALFSAFSTTRSLKKAVLGTTAAIKLVECYYHFPLFADAPHFQTEVLKMTALTTAFIAGVAWMAPVISYKRKVE